MIGKTISHYKILEKLGQGGMGDVYLAENIRLNLKVALKFLSPELRRDRTALKRFHNEAKSVAELSHPNIAQIHDIEEGEGNTFLVLEYVEGETLSDRVGQAPLSIDETLHIGKALAEGLAHAHASGIVHRDIKSSNVMLTSDGAVKIMDFGLALREDATRLTASGATVGTVSHMSPEQASGKPTEARSDLWSLGVVLYECLTGRLPFDADAREAVLYRITTESPEPPTALRSGIPMELERIVLKCLQKDPTLRYQHADEVLSDLKLLESGGRDWVGATSAAGRPGSDDRGSRRLIVGALILLAMVAGAAVLWPRLRPPGRGVDGVAADEHALAIVDFQDLAAPDDLTVSAGMTELVNTGLIEASPIRIVSSEYLHELRRKLFGSRRGPIEEDQALEVARKSGATLLLAGRMGRLGDEQFVTWRLVDTRSGESLSARRIEGMKLTGLADNIIAAVLPAIASACGLEPVARPVPVDQITTASTEAYEHYVAGLLATERFQAAKALDSFQRAVRLDSTFALGYFVLGRLQSGPVGATRDFAAAGKNLDKAWEFRSRLGIRDRMRLEAYRYQLGAGAKQMIEAYREILDRWPNDRETLADLAEQLFGFWDFRGAAEVYDRFLSVYPEGSMKGWAGAITSLRFTGRLSEALEADRRNVARDSANPNAWDELGLSFLALGMPDSAEVAFRTAIRLDPEDSYWPTSLALCEYARGKTAKAIEIYLEVLQEPELLRVERTFRLMDLADLYLDAGRYQDALAAAEMSESRPGTGRLLLAMGRPADALEIVEELADGQTVDRGDARWASFLQLRLRTKALVMMGDLDGARAGVDALYALEDQNWGNARYNAWQVEVEIALAENQPDVALEALDKMSQQGVGIAWRIHLVYREALARAHRMAGHLDKAVEVHQEMLRLYGGHALSWYELGKLYEEMKRADEAVESYTRFLKMWSEADEGLPQVADAQKRLAVLRQARN